jgi:Fe-Mn family superoxide dismutase
MAFTLPDLPYDPAKFAPFASPETFEFHHGKHHAAYVTKLNDALQGSAWVDLPLEEIIRKSFQENHKPVFNNAAQHFNHSFFWNCLSPEPTAPGSKTLELINRDFGSLEKFQEQFTAAATGLFGSGWVWLAQNQAGILEILPLKDAETPLIYDKKPLLTLDVWEHAYYIDHRNRRADYIKAFWNCTNWACPEQLLLS